MRNKEFENQKHKEKLLGKLLEYNGNEDQKSIPKTSPFLDFFQPFKTNKDKIFKPKTLLKTCIKTLVKVRNFALEILFKTPTQMGYL